MSNEIREPKQSRSIDKKNRIIHAGYELFSEIGYYNTTTAEIARRAGVSTGIVYGYFKDKRDILSDVLEIYIEKTFEPFFNMFGGAAVPLNYEKLFSTIVDKAIEAHNKNSKIHEVLHSMTHTDEEISKKFLSLEDDITLKFAEKLKNAGVETSNPYEKIHLAMNLVQSFAHEYVYDKHAYIDYGAMRRQVINILTSLFL